MEFLRCLWAGLWHAWNHSLHLLGTDERGLGYLGDACLNEWR